MPTSPVDFALAFSTGLVVFALALSGVMKIGNVEQTLRAMAALRVPTWLRHRAIASLVPFAELAIATGLLVLPGRLRVATAVAAALLLIVFTVFLLGVLHRGEDIDCGCFGTLSSSDRVSSWSIARNAGLIVASGAVAALAVGSGPFVIDFLASGPVHQLTVALAWALVAIALLAVNLVTARRSPRAISPASRVARDEVPPLSPLSLALGLDPARPGEVAMGDPIPSAELVTDRGITQPLTELAHGKPVILIFLSLDCSSCVPVAENIADWQQQLAPSGIELRVATSSAPAAIASAYPNVSSVARYGSRGALLALGVQRSPAAILLGGQQQQIIASPIAYGRFEIDALVSAASSSRV